MSVLPRSERSKLSQFYRLPGVLLLGCVVASPSVAQSSPDPDQVGQGVFLPAIGGTGGSQFKAPCTSDKQLAGFELRAGDDIDAIRPVCVTASITGSGKHETGPTSLTEGSGLVCKNDDLYCDTSVASTALAASNYAVAPGWYGGIGGHIERLLCPSNTPIVLGIDVRAEGVNTVTVNNIHLYCGQAVADQGIGRNPSNIFDAPGDDRAQQRTGSQRCDAGQVAVGVHGRAGKWLDAVGLICDAPRVKNYLALGRVGLDSPVDSSRKSICDAAKSARARNSPAAPGLERQCAASAPAPVLLGRVAARQPADPAQMNICDAAKSARARNSPAAPGLERQCQAAIDAQAKNELPPDE